MSDYGPKDGANLKENFYTAIFDPLRSGYARPRTAATPLPRVGLMEFSGLGLDTTTLPTDDQMDTILYGTDLSGQPVNEDQYIAQILSSSGIGAGRAEADVIVPMQNRLMYNLGQITDAIRTGQTPTLSTLLTLYSNVQSLANNFIKFVLSAQFTDRRASGQALNTVMPYIDGSCGYPVPLPSQATPSKSNCISWGDGTIGGVGTNGMLGAIARAIANAGGTAPGGGVITNPGTGTGSGGILSTMGLSSAQWVIVGLVALYLYGKKRGF